MASNKKELVNMQVHENDGIAVITICNPPVNAFSLAVITELKDRYNEAMERDDVKAIVLTGAGGKFSGGLDINLMRTVQKTGDVSMIADVSRDLVANIIEDGKKPSVAAIQGYALGGGLELAMGCSARIATPGAQLALPELTLGVIPGLGGTQRLPRLVGVSKAVDMLLSSALILSEEGNNTGLVDAIVSPEELIEASRQWALDIAEGRKSRSNSLCKVDKLCSLDEVHELLTTPRQETRNIAPDMLHIGACLDAIEDGITFGGYHGILKEQELFRDLVLSRTAKALVHVYVSQRAMLKVPGVTDVGLIPRSINKVAVVGGGSAGSGIVTALIMGNIHVVLQEISSECLLKTIANIEENLQELVRKGKFKQGRVQKVLSMLRGVSDYSEFKDVDMVIEAVFEEKSLKQSIFEEIEKNCSQDCILASATSSINLNVIGNRTSSQDRIAGVNFFSPAHVTPLLEIARTEKASSQAILDLMTVGKALKKVPIIVRDSTGFAVNRTFFPYTQAAYMLADLGIDIFRIDRVISTFGMPMGPFQLHDITGYGPAISFSKEMAAAFPERTYHSPLLDQMVRYGNKGKSNGKGFYIYEKGINPVPDPTVLPIIEESKNIANIKPREQIISLSDQEILEMVFFPVVNEACRVIEEGVVAQSSDLDIASVLGMKFPSHLGGIIFWADRVGSKYINTSLSKWAAIYGNFFKPSNYLEHRAVKGLSLSDPGCAGLTPEYITR